MICALLLVASIAAPTSDGQLDEQVIRTAMELYAEGRYADAAATLREAWSREGNPGYLFPLAQAERWAGECEPAIEHYRAYLETEPPAADVTAVHEGIAVCEQLLAAQSRSNVATAPAPRVDPKSVKPVEDIPAQPRRWYRDPAGGGLFAAGVVVSAIGSGLLGTALVRRDRRAVTEQAHDRLEQRVRRIGTAGIVTLSLGATALVAGVVRWAVVAARARRLARPR